MSDETGPINPDDWADARAIEVIARRKLTTKVMTDDGKPFGSITVDNSVPLIAAALREERERCARVADEFARPVCPGTVAGDVTQMTGKAIADAIRVVNKTDV